MVMINDKSKREGQRSEKEAIGQRFPNKNQQPGPLCEKLQLKSYTLTAPGRSPRRTGLKKAGKRKGCWPTCHSRSALSLTEGGTALGKTREKRVATVVLAASERLLLFPLAHVCLGLRSTSSWITTPTTRGFVFTHLDPDLPPPPPSATLAR